MVCNNYRKRKKLLPIRIPIYKNYIGWRVFFIRTGTQDKFSKVNNVSDIAFNKMPDAITSGLADFYPRSILEITRESNRLNNKELSIESSLLIKYPSTQYFFVNINDVTLAKTIEKGFQLAIKDGSFDRLFLRYYGENLKKLGLDKRRTFELKNPYFPSM